MRSRTLLACAAVAGMVALGACKAKPEKEQIRELIDDAVELVEEGELEELMIHFTEDAQARPMATSKEQVRGGFYMFFRERTKVGPFEIKHPYAFIEMNDEATEASTLLPFLVVHHKSRGAIDKSADEDHRRLEEPDWYRAIAGYRGDLYRIHIKFRKVNGDWRVFYGSVTGGHPLGGSTASAVPFSRSARRR